MAALPRATRGKTILRAPSASGCRSSETGQSEDASNLDTVGVLVSFYCITVVLDMPAWSPEIANEFIRLAAGDRRAFDQLQLQALIYIAHGWRLANTNEPLTGDRPEAWAFGPVYRRLADALAPYGEDLVHREIDVRFRSELDQSETDLIEEIYQTHGCFESWQLATLTSSDSAPWSVIFAGGSGEYRDIPHRLIRSHFVGLLDRSKASEAR